MACIICQNPKRGHIPIQKGKKICITCIYSILYRAFHPSSKIGPQWLAQAMKRDKKSQETIIHLVQTINELM